METRIEAEHKNVSKKGRIDRGDKDNQRESAILRVDEFPYHACAENGFKPRIRR